MIKPIAEHYSMSSPASVVDEEAMTALELAGRTAGKVNEMVGAFNEHEQLLYKELDKQDGKIEEMNASLPNLVSEKVGDYVDNGEFDNKINEYLGDLEERVDNLAASYTPGATTGDAELIDLRQTAHGAYKTAGEAVRGEMSLIAESENDAYKYLERGKFFYRRNRHNKNLLTVGFLLSGGTIGTGEDLSNYNTTEFINVIDANFVNMATFERILDPGARYVLKEGRLTFAFYDVTKTMIDGSYQTLTDTATKIVTIPNNAVYVRVSYLNTLELVVKLDDDALDYTLNTVIGVGGAALSDAIDTVNNVIVPSRNMFNKRTAKSGVLRGDGGDDQSDLYTVSDYIKVKGNQLYWVSTGGRQVAFYNEHKIYYKNMSFAGMTSFTPDVDGYIRVSFYNEYVNTGMVSAAQLPSSYVPFYYEIPDFAHNAKDMLTGKKWYACGDSFTVGGYYSSDTRNHKFTDEPYINKEMVYPYYIGRRTGMDVHVIGLSGMSLARSKANSTFMDYYQTIPEDADYITFKFGINDDHQNVPIGSIDSTDESTFMGAYNVVLTHVLNKAPLSKIGVIVTNGLSKTKSPYAEAIKAIAKKYGVMMLNEWDDPNVPYLLRSDAVVKGLSAEAHNIRFRAQAVDYDGSITGTANHHPNNQAHEYESTFVEAWLRTM